MTNEEMIAQANYDDLANNYDNESYAGRNNQQRLPAARQKANFDLVMVNASAETLSFELFNELKSFVENRNTTLVTSATVLYHPQTSFEGLLLAGVGVIGYTELGLLKATGALAATALTVDCPQYTYRALVKSSGRRPFRITGIRMTVTTDTQIDQEIIHFTNNFLGAKSENTLTPRTFFQPNQFQSKIVDIACNFPIDDQKGLVYKLVAGETVKWNVMIERDAV